MPNPAVAPAVEKLSPTAATARTARRRARTRCGTKPSNISSARPTTWQWDECPNPLGATLDQDGDAAAFSLQRAGAPGAERIALAGARQGDRGDGLLDVLPAGPLR